MNIIISQWNALSVEQQLDTMPDVTLDILTVKELSKILRLGINNTYTLVRNGTIFSVRVGRQYRIPRSAVVKYLKEQNDDCA